MKAVNSAQPLAVKQAPDFRALGKTANLILESLPLSTPPMAQEYLEPGVNVKLTKRKTPKTNYTLPSDLPKYPLGFVPTQNGAQLGDETSAPQIKPYRDWETDRKSTRLNSSH